MQGFLQRGKSWAYIHIEMWFSIHWFFFKWHIFLKVPPNFWLVFDGNGWVSPPSSSTWVHPCSSESSGICTEWVQSCQPQRRKDCASSIFLRKHLCSNVNTIIIMWHSIKDCHFLGRLTNITFGRINSEGWGGWERSPNCFFIYSSPKHIIPLT